MSSNIHGPTPGRSHGKPGLWLPSAPSGPFGGHATLGDAKHYWKLNEESGARADEVNGLTLADNNTVLYGAGLYGNAALFVRAQSEDLRETVVGAFPGGETAGTVSAWLSSTSAGAEALAYFTADYVRLSCYHYPNAPFSFWGELRVFDGAGWRIGGAAWDHSAPASGDGNWVHLVGTFEFPGKVKFYLNTVQLGIEQAMTAGHEANTQYTYMGSLAGASNYMNGLIWGLGVWHRVLTSDEISDLYNSGSGLDY